MAAPGRKYDVKLPLTAMVSHIYGINLTEDNEPAVYHLSPSLEMMLVFNFGPAIAFSFGEEEIADQQVERIGILGPLRKMLNYELQAGADLLILPFVLDGFYRFMSLAGTSVDLSVEENIMKYAQQLDLLWEKLYALPDPEARVVLLKNYLEQAMDVKETGAELLLQNAGAFYDPGLSPTRVMAEKANFSERAVQMRFKKYVGYSPKELLRFLRFKQVVAWLMERQGKPVDWFDVIVQFGYHDQSHLIKDFKYYTGGTPTQFLVMKDAGSFCVSRD